MANWLAPQIANGDFSYFLRMHVVLAKNYRGFEDTEIPLDVFMNALSKDKKNTEKNRVTLILPNKNAEIEKGSYKNDTMLRHLCQKYLTKIRFQ